jgi:hypothetical protein
VHRVSISLRIASQISKHDAVHGEHPDGYTQVDVLNFQAAGIMADYANNDW